jgi:Uma2 family endonuclease
VNEKRASTTTVNLVEVSLPPSRTEVAMATVSQTVESPISADVPTLPVYRFTVSQYLGMIRHGLIDEDAKVELLDGWVIQKMRKGQPHNIASGLLADALFRQVPSGFYVGREEPVLASDESVPEPDVMLVRGARNDFPDTPPQTIDVVLVVEVADASLSRDTGEKKRIYASAGFPVYWLVNLPARCVEIYSDPTGPSPHPDYRSRRECYANDELSLLIDGREIGRWIVRELLPKGSE